MTEGNSCALAAVGSKIRDNVRRARKPVEKADFRAQD